MKCSNCGFERAENFAFCPNCGTPYVAPQPVVIPQPVVAEPVVQAVPIVETIPQAAQPTPQPVVADHPLNRVLFLLKDPMYLVVCILISTSCLFSLANGLDSLIINGLLTIFCWLTYAKGRKNVISASHLRCISGTVFASYVINYVLCGLLALAGVIFLGITSMSSSYIFNEVLEELDMFYGFLYSGMPLMVVGVLMFIVCLIAAAVVFVINFLGVRKIHGFTKELYQSVQLGNIYVTHTRIVRTWLFILAGYTALGAFFSGAAFFANGSMAAAAILAGLLVNKYLLTVD